MQKSEKWATSPIISLIQLKDENRMRFHRQEKEARVFFMENAWIESDCFSGGHVTNRIPLRKTLHFVSDRDSNVAFRSVAIGDERPSLTRGKRVQTMSGLRHKNVQ